MPGGQLHSIAQGADAHGLNDHVAVRVVRIADALSRIATRLIEARWGLKNTDLRIMNALDGEADGLAVSELARRVHVDKAWVSRLLAGLEQRGLVEKRADAVDTRKTLVALSPIGRDTLEEVRPHALRGELVLLEGLDARALKAMLDRLEANAAAFLETLG